MESVGRKANLLGDGVPVNVNCVKAGICTTKEELAAVRGEVKAENASVDGAL